MRLKFRSAKAADAAEVTALHLASWRDVYRGIVDDGFLDGPLPGLLEAHWQERLAAGDRSLVVVLALLGGEPAGFAAFLRHGATAHVDNLHVRPGLRGAGVGRALLAFGTRRMRLRGCAAADLVVFAGNEGALRFYTALGATVGVEEPGETFGQKVVQRRCSWSDIGALIAAAEAVRA